MTLSDMAREIERRRPGTLPKSIVTRNPYRISATLVGDRGVSCEVPDDLAHAILRDSMVMAAELARDNEFNCWTDPHFCHYHDSDHGGCPTRSAFAAFCEVFKEKPDGN